MSVPWEEGAAKKKTWSWYKKQFYGGNDQLGRFKKNIKAKKKNSHNPRRQHIHRFKYIYVLIDYSKFTEYRYYFKYKFKTTFVFSKGLYVNRHFFINSYLCAEESYIIVSFPHFRTIWVISIYYSIFSNQHNLKYFCVQLLIQLHITTGIESQKCYYCNNYV